LQFTQPSIVPESAFPRILELMATGRLFRYCGKGGAEGSDASVAEQMVADYIGADYCIGVNSCSSAIYLALLALGVKHGDKVITNGFTFTALPSTIKHAGATPVLVEANENFTMNVEDLEKKIAANPDAKVMILSHFRGKLSDCDTIREICDKNGILMVEDCAHGMGCTWNGEQAGKIGDISVFSCQSDKVVNAGEGGFLTTNNPEWAAQCVYWSGAYEKRYEYHLAAPIENTELMTHVMTSCQNNSLRMNNVSGAMIVAQMDELSDRVDHWNAMGDVIMKGLEPVSDLIIVPKGEPGAGECFDHCVFSTPSFNQEQRDFFTKECKALGVDVKPFGTVDNARFFKNWKFLNNIPDMPHTENIVRHAFDMKVPFNFTASDWEHISAIMCEVARKTDALN